MAARIDVQAEVGAFVQKLKDAAEDAHEVRTLMLIAQQVMSQYVMDASRAADEAAAALVLSARAASTGVSVDDQKNAAGALLNKRPEAVTAADVLQVVVFDQPVAVDEQPVPAPVSSTPAAGP
jgi:hypothetical protein